MRGLVALGVAAAGAVIVLRCLPKTRRRLSGAAGIWLTRHMERMMARLPDGAPPKLVMSILPKLLAQNDQIIAMLREQNRLLRQPQHIAR